jgi:type I site-specific restriction-modification system R (restriction) subunit
MPQAVKDGATVPIYYESRVAKLELPEELKPVIDDEFEEITEDEEEGLKHRLKSRWAQLEALVGSDNRLANVAADIVVHFERRNSQMPGKGMIVCMSRRICVKLYEEIRRIRPDWHDGDDDKGQMKIVMTGSASDVTEFQPISATSLGGRIEPTDSSAPTTRSSSSSCAICGSPASMRRASTRCISTSPCMGTASCRRSPG